MIAMFKNCVFKVSVDTKKWMKSAGIRAVKTMAQTAVSIVAVGNTVASVFGGSGRCCQLIDFCCGYSGSGRRKKMKSSV